MIKGLLDQERRQIAEGAPFLIATRDQRLIHAIGNGDGDATGSAKGGWLGVQVGGAPAMNRRLRGRSFSTSQIMAPSQGTITHF